MHMSSLLHPTSKQASKQTCAHITKMYNAMQSDTTHSDFVAIRLNLLAHIRLHPIHCLPVLPTLPTSPTLHTVHASHATHT